MNKKIDIARDEVKLLADKVNHLDNLRFRCRQMAAALSLAVVGFAASHDVKWAYVAGTICPFAFWITESHYRRAEQICIGRLKSIEMFLQKELSNDLADSLSNFLVPDAFNLASKDKSVGLAWNFFRPTMMLFYLPLIFIGLVLVLNN